MYFLTKLANKFIWSSLSFKHGTKSKFFPPDPKKLSFPSIDISSSVSTQSEAKPGQITNTFFLSSLGSFSRVLSV